MQVVNLSMSERIAAYSYIYIYIHIYIYIWISYLLTIAGKVKNHASTTLRPAIAVSNP